MGLPETNYSHLTTFQANGQATSKTKKKIINYDASGKRTHTCDRCGKSFNNGHALGGHKKYCGKAEFTGVTRQVLIQQIIIINIINSTNTINTINMINTININI